MTATAPPAERLDPDLLTALDAMRVCGFEHVDSVRKRTRTSWSGPGERIHAHRLAGQLRFRRAVLDCWLAGGGYAQQVAVCGPTCPERVATRPPARPGRRR